MGKIILVSSGKGGAGKSTVSAYLGHSLQMLGKKTIIIELDSGLRSLDIMLGLEDESCFDLYDILSGECDPNKAIRTAEHFGSLQFIPAPSSPSGNIDTDRFVALCVALKKNYDFVIIDSPAGVGALFKLAAEASDSAIVVATPDSVCVRDAAFVGELLDDYALSEKRLCINRFDIDQFKKSSFRDLDEVIDRVGVRLIGIVPSCEHIPSCSSRGEVLPSDSKAKTAFLNIAKRITGEEAELSIR